MNDPIILEEISQELILASAGGTIDFVKFLLDQYDGIIDLDFQEPEVSSLETLLIKESLFLFDL